MKRVIAVLSVSALSLSGCALTHEQVVQRAKQKSDTELCMATIQFPQYGNEIAAELAERGHTCDWTLTAAQVQAQAASDANRRAALQAAATAFNAQPAYKIVPPAQLTSPAAPATAALAPATVTAFWTGKQQQVQTVTNQFGWSCEYNYAGRTFWRTFVGTCPTSVQAQ